MCTVHSATSAVLAVVGDGRSGDPLHERDDKRDVYEGEVAKVDLVSELVRRFELSRLLNPNPYLRIP